MLSDKKVIIGLGSGRCGTVTLYKILNRYNADVSHEKMQMPWEFNLTELHHNIENMEHRYQPVVGDVACWWLNYVDYMKENVKDIKFVCLKRNKQDTLNSFMERFKYEDYWTEKGMFPEYIDGIQTLTGVFPVLPLKDKRAALSFYYDLYYQIAEEHVGNNFRIFDMWTLLNVKHQQQCLFDWLELPTHTPIIGQKWNNKKDIYNYEDVLDENHPINYGKRLQGVTA